MMKNIFALYMILMAGILNSHAQQHSAVLVVQYGSTVKDTRVKTIDAIFSDIKVANSDIEVREAYIAEMVRKKLAKKGIHKDSPLEALLRLHLEGYDTVYVQPTLLLDGIEMRLLRDEVAQASQFFKKVEVGTPLLYTLDDFREFMPVLQSEQPEKGSSIVWVGHGNQFASTGAYCILNDMLHETGYIHSFVSTIEGYPTTDNIIFSLTRAKTKQVTLVPLLLVCGEHSINDINGTVRSVLEARGFRPKVLLKGLGERPEVRRLYIDKVSKLRKN